MSHCTGQGLSNATLSMSSKRSVPEAAWAAMSMRWGPSSPAPLYLSYGMVSLKGRRPALTDAVGAAESFTALSPPLGLDYFAVFDGGHLGAPAAERLRARLAAAIAEQIDGELRSEMPRFGAAKQDVAGWWRTTVQEAFRAVNGEAVSGAVVALVLEKYIVVATCGSSKAVLSRGGDHVELASDDHRLGMETYSDMNLSSKSNEEKRPSNSLMEITEANYRGKLCYQEITEASVSDDGCSCFHPKNKIKQCSTFSSQFSLSKMVRLLDKLTNTQQAIVRDLGLGSILALKCTCIPNSLVLWLAAHYNPSTECVDLGNGRIFRIDAITTHGILGIPYGGNKVPTKSSSQAKAVILKDTNQTNQAAKIDDLIDMINADLVGDKFARLFMLVVLGIFLCPSSSPRVSHRYYEAISTVSKIRSYDWCTSVADCLNFGIVNFHSNVCKGNITGTATLSGCLFLLVATYFDYLVVEHSIVEATIPRICIWDDKAIAAYRQAEPPTEHIQFKSVEATLFKKNRMNSPTFRGFNILRTISNDTHDETEVIPDLKTTPQKTTNHSAGKGASIDFQSAKKVIPGSSDIFLRVLCGEILHPEVDLFIKPTIGTTASGELHVRAQANRADEKQSVGNAPGVMDSTSKAHDDAGSVQHGPVAAAPDVVAVERTARDDFLVLASDGLWDAVAPVAACAHVRRRLVKTSKIARPWEPPLDARGSPTVLAKELAEQAVRASGQDNVSIVLVLFRDFWARTPWHGNY